MLKNPFKFQIVLPISYIKYRPISIVAALETKKAATMPIAPEKISIKNQVKEPSCMSKKSSIKFAAIKYKIIAAINLKAFIKNETLPQRTNLLNIKQILL